MQGILDNPVSATVGLIILALVIILIAILCTWKKVPSDKAAVIVGLGRPKVVTGGGTVVIPIIQRIDTITLENIMFNVEIRQTKTSLGVPINTEGVVVLKVKNDESSILAAVQQFSCARENDTVNTIRTQASEVCKGKLREIVSSMSVEDIYNDRESFAAKVQSVAGTELGDMGLELKSFTINDITDDEGYIEALGKEQIAKVKSSAAIAEAEALKEQQIKTADARKIGKQAELEAEAQIAEAEKNKQLKVLAYQKEQQTQKAVADAAYQIQANITLKDVTNTEMDATVIESQRRKEVAEADVQVQIVAEIKNIELAKKKAERAEAELIEKVVKPAEAEKQKLQLNSEAKKFEQVKRAEADAETKKLDAVAEAEKLRLEGEAQAKIIEAKGQAEADSIKAKGLAEAEALEKKAEALAKMDEAGKLQMVIEKLPEIARAVAEPMSKIGNITIIGGGSGSDDGATNVARYAVGAMKAVNEAVKETIGFDLTEVMRANTFEGKTTTNINLDMKRLNDSGDIIKNTVSAAIAPEIMKESDILDKDQK